MVWLSLSLQELQYATVLHHTVLHSSVLHHAALCCTILHSATWCILLPPQIVANLASFQRAPLPSPTATAPDSRPPDADSVCTSNRSSSSSSGTDGGDITNRVCTSNGSTSSSSGGAGGGARDSSSPTSAPTSALGLASSGSSSGGTSSNAPLEHRLVVRPRHVEALPPHGCPLCPANLCKGAELRRLRAARGATYRRVVYCGAGADNLCPALELVAGDVLLARRCVLSTMRPQPCPRHHAQPSPPKPTPTPAHARWVDVGLLMTGQLMMLVSCRTLSFVPYHLFCDVLSHCGAATAL